MITMVRKAHFTYGEKQRITKEINGVDHGMA